MWEVVATVKEPLPLVAAFVAHHLKVGADLIHVYFDDPADPGYDLIVGTPRVNAIRCDGGYWSVRGGRPPMHTDRQNANANDAADRCASPWILHCDADEFLIRPSRLREKLAVMDPNVLSVRLRAWERCFAGAPGDAMFAGWARGPTKEHDILQKVYGDVALRLGRGMAGYFGFKSVSRPHCGLFINNHGCSFRASNGAEDCSRKPTRETLYAPHVLHFDGITPAHLNAKFASKRVGPTRDELAQRISPHRMAQVKALTHGNECPVDHFRQLRQVPPDKMSLLSDINRLEPIKMNPAADALKRWPDAGLEFSAAAFDALL